MDHLEFGRYLTVQRELRGMSREEVGAQTKIPPSILTALETGQAERLPARVFVINYIKAYAKAIGLEPDEAVLRFEEIYTGSHTALTPVEQERRRKTRAWKTLVSLVLALAAVAAVIVYLQLRGGAQ